MNVERNLICGNVLAENRTDNLVELHQGAAVDQGVGQNRGY